MHFSYLILQLSAILTSLLLITQVFTSPVYFPPLSLSYSNEPNGKPIQERQIPAFDMFTPKPTTPKASNLDQLASMIATKIWPNPAAMAMPTTSSSSQVDREGPSAVTKELGGGEATVAIVDITSTTSATPSSPFETSPAPTNPNPDQHIPPSVTSTPSPSIPVISTPTPITNTTTIILSSNTAPTTFAGLPAWGWFLVALGVILLSSGIGIHRFVKLRKERKAARAAEEAEKERKEREEAERVAEGKRMGVEGEESDAEESDGGV